MALVSLLCICHTFIHLWWHRVFILGSITYNIVHSRISDIVEKLTIWDWLKYFAVFLNRRTPPRRSPPKRRNSTIGDDDSSKRYKRSRSKSPVVRNRNDRENHSPVRPPNRDNSPRPNERRSRSPRQNDRRSRSPRQNDRRSRSPRQNDRRQVKRPTSRLRYDHTICQVEFANFN